MFSWQRFLDQYRIDYTDRGRNVSKNNLALACPFCGDDPSFHMNVSLKGYGYACWRSVSHRGKNNAKLVQQLLKCSWAEAIKIVGGDIEVPTDEDFGTRMDRLLHPDKSIPAELKMPVDWKRLDKGSGLHRNLVLEYIKRRGYSEHAALKQATRYNIHYGIHDRWDRRVIWPIYNENDELVNYTGRAISVRQKVRYKTLAGEFARARMSECLFDMQMISRTRAEVLVVVEGPFDAMRLGWIGEPLGIYATCVFTQNVSDTQAALLQQLAYKFQKVVVLFDQGADLQSFRAASRLGFERMKLPENVKDPDTLSAIQSLGLCRQLLA